MTLKQNWTDKDVITATFLNELVTKVNAGGSSTVDGLTDASALGKSLAKAANAAAARTAIGAMAKAEADQNYAPLWQPSTAYTAGALVLLPAPINGPGTRTTAGNSRSTFDAIEQALWTPTGGGSSVSITDNGDGTATLSGPGISDNGDGTATITG